MLYCVVLCALRAIARCLQCHLADPGIRGDVVACNYLTETLPDDPDPPIVLVKLNLQEHAKLCFLDKVRFIGGSFLAAPYAP